MFLLMLICVVPDLAHRLRHAVLAVPGPRPVRRLAGGSFSVGTPYVARWFPRNQQGIAMGVYGAGNSGAAVNKFVAPGAAGRLRLDDGAAGLRRDHARHGDPVLVVQPQTRQHLVDSTVAFRDQLKALKGPEGLKVPPVLLDRVRRLRRDVAVDGAVLRRRVRPRHPRRRCSPRASPARRRAARGRRLALRQVRRAPDHVVGAVGELDLPVPPRTRRPT